MEFSFDKSQYDKIIREKLEHLKEIYPFYPKNNWQLEKEKYGIKIHSMFDAKTQLKIIRSQGIIKAPVSKIVEMGQNIEIATQWDNTLESVKILHKEGDNCAVIKTLTKKTPLIAPRESLFLSNIIKEENDDSTYIISTSIDCPAIKESEGCVRAKIHLLGWVMTPDAYDSNLTVFTVVLHVDPKGWIPKAIFNSFAYEQGFNMRFLAEYAERKSVEETSSEEEDCEEMRKNVKIVVSAGLKKVMSVDISSRGS